MGEKQKLSGRPADGAAKRTRKIDVRFTEDEYQSIKKLERELGLTQTDLVRKRILNNSGRTVINAQALLTEIDKAGAELARSGNNINQLAHHANSLHLKGQVSEPVITQFNQLMESYLRLQAQLEISLRKILRAMA